jgi:hypothetical protein
MHGKEVSRDAEGRGEVLPSRRLDSAYVSLSGISVADSIFTVHLSFLKFSSAIKHSQFREFFGIRHLSVSSFCILAKIFLVCCIFRWVKVEIDSKKHGNVPSIFADEPTCFRPPTLRDIPLSGVPSDEFTCDHDYYFYYEDNESAAVEDSI